MLRTVALATLIGASAAVAIPTAAPAATTGNVIVCIANTPDSGKGRFLVVPLGDSNNANRSTPVLNADGIPGNGDDCWNSGTVNRGPYRITPGKYLNALCYKTANGRLVNPPVLVTNGARCDGKIHNWRHEGGSTFDDRFASTEAIDVMVDDTSEVVIAHVTDKRFFECNDGQSNAVCEPTGPTG